ncbi:MAG: class I SAM-dependent methyltransferase [Candidatus Hatepunaea meridiana]|nr:class I SAM-dependent methyltransferase [Candidatus Hatepunaea meridiana]
MKAKRSANGSYSEKQIEKRVRVEPYHILARIYDQVMSHVDYTSWADFVLEILTDYGLSAFPDESSLCQNLTTSELRQVLTPDAPMSLLECACGTGTVSINLAIRGYHIEACDESGRMIEVARSKAASLRNPPLFFVKDFLDLDEDDCYDAVLCLYDSVNYLLQTDQVEDYFNCVKRALKPDGLFLFDVCTEYNSLMNFQSGDYEEQGSDFSYIRIMQYHRETKIQENRFLIRLDDAPGITYEEVHLQRIYDLGTIRILLESVGFKIEEETDDIQRTTPQEDSLRVHFLCRNK